jgi:hypothetical protein
MGLMEETERVGSGWDLFRVVSNAVLSVRFLLLKSWLPDSERSERLYNLSKYTVNDMSLPQKETANLSYESIACREKCPLCIS